MEPAASIIAKFAVHDAQGKCVSSGESEVARLTATAYTAPYRWKSSKDKGGTDGRIPQKYIQGLLEAARARTIPLSLEDFFPGEQAAIGGTATAGTAA